MPTGAGKLEFKIDLIKKQDSSTTVSGSTKVNYQIIVAKRWANSKIIGERQGHQFLTTKNIQETSTHKFIVRYNATFDNRGKVDHIQFRDQLYEIQNVVTERERERFLIFECRMLGDSSNFNIVPIP